LLGLYNNRSPYEYTDSAVSSRQRNAAMFCASKCNFTHLKFELKSLTGYIIFDNVQK